MDDGGSRSNCKPLEGDVEEDVLPPFDAGAIAGRIGLALSREVRVECREGEEEERGSWKEEWSERYLERPVVGLLEVMVRVGEDGVGTRLPCWRVIGVVDQMLS